MLCKLLAEDAVSIPYYWYLDFILFWYLIFYAVIRIPNLYRYRYIVLGIASILVFVIGCILNNGLRSEQAISFLIGVWVSDNWDKAKTKLTKASALVLLLIISVILLVCKQVPFVRALEGSMEWQLIQLIMKVSASLVIIGLSYKFEVLVNNRMIGFIGGISYEIYLVHYQILWMPNTVNLGIIGFITITLIGAYLLHLSINGLKKYVS